MKKRKPKLERIDITLLPKTERRSGVILLALLDLLRAKLEAQR